MLVNPIPSSNDPVGVFRQHGCYCFLGGVGVGVGGIQLELGVQFACFLDSNHITVESSLHWT